MPERIEQRTNKAFQDPFDPSGSAISPGSDATIDAGVSDETVEDRLEANRLARFTTGESGVAAASAGDGVSDALEAKRLDRWDKLGTAASDGDGQSAGEAASGEQITEF